MNIKKIIVLTILSLVLSLQLEAQQVIRLTNPSFEEIPHNGIKGYSPKGWLDCGVINFPNESPPDIQPGFFAVDMPAFKGKSYLGLIVRDNDTWEGVSQRLSSPLKAGNCYKISLYLAKSETYISSRGDRKSNTPTQNQDVVNHNTPVTLRIWGGNDYCDKKENFIVSDAIDHTQWVKYTFKLKPQSKITHISFEAFYKTPVFFPYNGNLLIDNISEITQINCDDNLEEKPYVEIISPIKEKTTVDEELFHLKAKTLNLSDKTNIVIVINNQLLEEFTLNNDILEADIRLFRGKNSITVTIKNSTGSATDKATITFDYPDIVMDTPKEKPAPISTPTKTVIKPPKINKFEKKNLRKGQTIRIENLYFASNSYKIEEKSNNSLNEIYKFMKDNPDIYIEIGGHSNGIPSHEFCDKLSKLRAKSVATYLVNKGISANRLKYKGYGKRKPIASNKTKEGRIKNQRVEIKILSIG